MAAALAARAGTLRWAVGGWTFFIAENAILSENRTAIIDAVGEQQYHALYGGISTTACLSIAYGYFKKVQHAPPLQWPLAAAVPASRMACAFALQAAGLAGAAQALPKLQVPFQRKEAPAPSVPAQQQQQQQSQAASKVWAVRCPFDFAPPASVDGGVVGAERVSRHLGLWSFAAFSLGAAVAVPSVPQAVCLAMPTLVALVGGAHADSRYARGLGGSLPPEHAAQTSNVPFLAMLTGAQGPAPFGKLLDESKVLNAAVAAAVAALWALRRFP